MKITAIAMVLIVISGVAEGQSATTPAPTPCLNAPERHQFDFWLGEWDVKTKNGSPAGTSVIQSVSGGCALLENWTSARGGNGKSINAYNPAIKQWQQYWIGQDGAVTEFRTSEYHGTSLSFFARHEAKPDSVDRMTFTPLDSATVRQHGESSSDRGKNWTTTFDLYYHRKSK
jgi:hypothetical protein